MYQFLVTAVTIHYKFNGLKQHEFISLHFWRSEAENESYVAKIKVLVGLVPSRISRAESTFFPFLALEATCILWLMTQSMALQYLKSPCFHCHSAFVCSQPFHCFLLIKTLGNTFRFHLDIPGDIPDHLPPQDC